MDALHQVGGVAGDLKGMTEREAELAEWMEDWGLWFLGAARRESRGFDDWGGEESLREKE